MLLRHIEFMNLAEKQAKTDNTSKSYRFGTILANKRKLISMGVNRPYHTHTKSIGYRFDSIHAEVDCLLGVDSEKVKGATMYIFRLSRGGKPGISKPCQRCEQILRDSGVKDVYYLDRNAEIRRMRLN
jgi:deoxycytidylate deaminase